MTIQFSELVSNYPSDRSPCSGPWNNQCAIRTSIALEGAGFSFSDYRDPQCAHGHARGAESLANHLWHKLGAPRIYKTGAKAALASKQGIVLFKDIAGFRNGIGDHIDLWRASQGTMTGEYFSYCKQVWFFSIA